MSLRVASTSRPAAHTSRQAALCSGGMKCTQVDRLQCGQVTWDAPVCVVLRLCAEPCMLAEPCAGACRCVLSHRPPLAHVMLRLHAHGWVGQDGSSHHSSQHKSHTKMPACTAAEPQWSADVSAVRPCICWHAPVMSTTGTEILARSYSAP